MPPVMITKVWPVARSMTVVEATSGNTGIAFSAIGRALGHAVTIFMPDWMSEERKSLIRSFGAEIVPVSHEEGVLADPLPGVF